MTYGNSIESLSATISKSIGRVVINLQHRSVKITIGDEVWEANDCDAVVATEAYLSGIVNGYVAGVKYSLGKIETLSVPKPTICTMVSKTN